MTSTARFATFALVTIVGVGGLGVSPKAQNRRDGHGDHDDRINHVLLLSVDGLHAFDLARFIANNPDSALARLSQHGRTYTNAFATRPSDSFPGLLAMVTGGTPRSTGVFYDDSWDRSLAKNDGLCVPGANVVWKQGLDVLPFSFATTIDPAKLPRDPADRCTRPVWPHQFPRVNNIFEIVKAAGGRTAWSDKHPAYEFLNGPSGTGIDDLYTPEITAPAGVATTNSFALTMAYDDMKVAAILNEIRGFDHAGAIFIGVPTVFGMNFQAVSVGQKLKVEQVLTAPPLTGGYLDTAGAPSDGLLKTLEHTDQSIGAMVDELNRQGLLGSTMIIVSAKHANSPVDLGSLVRVNPLAISSIVNPIVAHHLSADTGPMIWLKGQKTPEEQQSNTEKVVAALTDSMMNGGNPARISRILSGSELTALFQDPLTDSRTPDIILVPQPGTVYTTSGSKIADHGGFGDEDVHVGLLVSQPSMPRRTITDQVETRQIACTILKALALSCRDLMSQQVEPSTFLPHSNRERRDDSRGVTSVKPKRR